MKENVTQAEVDAAKAKLNAAKAKLTGEPTNTKELEKLLEKNDEIIKTPKYYNSTPAIKEWRDTLIKEAKELLTKKNTTQEEIDTVFTISKSLLVVLIKS